MQADDVSSRCSSCRGPAWVGAYHIELFGKPDPPKLICEPCQTKEQYGDQNPQRNWFDYALPDANWTFEFLTHVDKNALPQIMYGFDVAKEKFDDYASKLIEATKSIQASSEALAQRISYCQSCGATVGDRSGRSYCQKCMRAQWRRAKN